MDEEVPVRPVLFIRFFVNHYFVVVVDYEEDMMFTFGRHINPDLAGVYTHNEEIAPVARTMVMATLAELFQWECFSTAPNHVLSVNWEQVGVIPAFPPFFFVLFFVITFVLTGRSFTEWARLCPVACSVTKALLSNGIECDEEGYPVVPTIECAHYSRLRLLNETIDRLQHCYHLYRQTMQLA